MEGLDKKMIRVLRELEERWWPGSIPAMMLSAAANVLERYFAQNPDWESDIAEYEEDADV